MMGNTAFLFINAMRIIRGTVWRPKKRASIRILTFADQGSERTQGHGGLRVTSMFDTKAKKTAMLKVPPKQIAFTAREGAGLLLERKRAVVPRTQRERR